MARPSATAAVILLVLSLLAVAHCHTLRVDHDTEPESTSVVADENGLSSSPTLPAEASTSATEEAEKVLPTEQQHGSEFLRLPSHRLHRHRPCSLHHHLWWKRHRDVHRDAPRRFRDHYSGHGERREVKPVAEPDPDRSLQGSDGEVDLEASRDPLFADGHDDERAAVVRAWKKEVLRSSVAEPDPDRTIPASDDGEMVLVSNREPSFADGHDDEPTAAVRAWKKEMLRRWIHFHFHHGMRRHRLHHVHHDDNEEEEAAPEGMMNMKRFHHYHHDEEDEEIKNMVRKRLRRAEDSDDEEEQVEEMVRRFRKAIMRRRFGHGHGRRFFHHLHHNHSRRHAEEQTEKSGVVAWIKRLMDRF